MATLFSRRYLRDHPSATEKVIGAGILLLLVGIGLVFAALTVRDEPPLFELADEATRSPEAGPQARSLRVARSMMPPLGTAGWSLDGAITVTASADLPEPLADYGTTLRYQGRYVNLADSTQFVAVRIHATPAPENAMALFHLLAPEEHSPLSAGNGGWAQGDRGGFWAGRYYTEFDRSTVKTDQPNRKVITDALASVQITYGPPFWAQDVFPAEGQVAGTFRYAPIGQRLVPLLTGCFATTYDDGTVALAKRTTSTAEGVQLLGRIADQLGRDAQLTQVPSDDQPVVSGPVGDQYVFLFAQADVICGSIGPDAGAVSRIASLMLERVRPAAGAVASGRASAGDDQSPFPPIDLTGWSRPDNTRVFTATNLWEKINGRADIYLTYNVATLTFGTYRGDKDMALDVYWYDMTEVDNAFGIYQAEYGGYAEPAPVGREGYRSGSSVFFWIGAHYVRLESPEESTELTEAALAVASAIAATVPDNGQPLWADALLPQQDRLPDSFEYQAESAFGLDFLSATFAADYESDAQRYKLFIHRAPDADSAAKTLAAYVQFFDDYGKVLQRGGDADSVLVGESGGVIDAVFATGRYLGGVSGTTNAQQARRRAVAFRSLLSEAESSGQEGE